MSSGDIVGEPGGRSSNPKHWTSEDIARAGDHANTAQDGLQELKDRFNRVGQHHTETLDAADTAYDSLSTALGALRTYFEEINATKAACEASRNPAQTAHEAIESLADTGLTTSATHLQAEVDSYAKTVETAGQHVTETDLTILDNLKERLEQVQDTLGSTQQKPREIVDEATGLYQASQRVIEDL